MFKRPTLLIVVGICAAVRAHPARAQKSPLGQAAYARAQEHLAASRFAEAATEMETAVRFEPRFALGWYVLASASRRAAHCDRAVAAYRRYMELRPTEPDPYFGAALCLEAVGDKEAALAAFRHYVESDRRSESRTYVEISRKRLADLGRPDVHAKTAAKTPPKPAGGAATGAGGARGSGSPLLAASPPLIEARRLRDHGKARDAISRYRAAIAADPSLPEAHVELGGLLIANHNFTEAADELRTAVRLAPTESHAWYNLGFALRETGQAAAAVEAYQRYITFKPTDPDPHYGLGLALATLGRNDEALTELRTYATLETRPTEKRWVNKARAEILRIESASPGPRATPIAPAAIAPPTLTTPPPERNRGDGPRSGDARH